MEMLIKAMIAAAALAFVLAVVGSAFTSGHVLGIGAEAYSRASNNLALLAIAAAVCLTGKAASSGDA
jgi:hypothetical protein